MKGTSILAACILMAACGQQNAQNASQTSTTTTTQPALLLDTTNHFISLDTGNKMLSSYLNSINANSNDSDLRSLILPADAIRTLLATPKAANVKIMFAHTLNYINNGGRDKNCGYQSGKLTVILAAYDSSGNYLYTPANKVLDLAAPCPSSCPGSGSASSNLLQ